MDILVIVIKMTFQLILCRMFSAMGVLVKYVKQAPQRFVGNTLLCAIVLLAFMSWRRYTLRKSRQVANRFAAQLEESREFTLIRQTQAREVSVSPPEGARPLKLQTLCLAVVLENINRFYPLLEAILKEEQNDELPELSFHRVMMPCTEVQTCLFEESSDSLQVQGAETENILEASQTHANQVDKEKPNDLVKMAHPKGNRQLFSQEAAKWTEGAQGTGELEQEACVKIEVMSEFDVV